MNAALNVAARPKSGDCILAWHATDPLRAVNSADDTADRKLLLCAPKGSELLGSTPKWLHSCCEEMLARPVLPILEKTGFYERVRIGNDFYPSVFEGKEVLQDLHDMDRCHLGL